MTEEKSFLVQKTQVIIPVSDYVDLTDTGWYSEITKLVKAHVTREVEQAHPGCKIVLMEVRKLEDKRDSSADAFIKGDEKRYIVADVAYAFSE